MIEKIRSGSFDSAKDIIDELDLEYKDKMNLILRYIKDNRISKRNQKLDNDFIQVIKPITKYSDKKYLRKIIKNIDHLVS